MKTFTEWLAETVSPKWVIAPRMTDRIRWQYPDHVNIHPKRFARLQHDYAEYVAAEIGTDLLTAAKAILAMPAYHRPRDEDSGPFLALERAVTAAERAEAA